MATAVKRGTLGGCGKAAGFSVEQIKEIRSEADGYKTDGHTGPDSIKMAIDARLSDLNGERDSIIRQIRKQLGEGEPNDATGNSTDSPTALEGSQPDLHGTTGEEGGTGATNGSISEVDSGRDGNTDVVGDDGNGSVAGEPTAVLPDGPEDVVRLDNPAEPRGLNRSGVNPGNFVITPDMAIGTGTDGQRIANNLAAIRLVKQLDAENRYATSDEQEVLARYVGWGGLKKTFDPSSKSAQEQRARKELTDTLTPAEYDAAFQSTLDAHYTSLDVINSIYKIVDHFGFQGGHVMEPTYGAGNFIGAMPADMAASSKWYGSELDPTTAKIGQYLYPDSQLINSGFQEAEFPYGKFDLAIGNPPFGDQRIADLNKKRSDINRFKIHNYIIAKSGMHLKPGGVMAMVVTSRFMDTKNDEARSNLDKTFKFLTAIRLPNNAFAKNAGTEVTTDLVFFQKLMPGEVADDQYKGWLETGASITNERGEEVTLNKWFAKRPELMLGIPSMQGTMYGPGLEFTLEKREGQDIAAEIDKILASEDFAKHKDIIKEKTVDQLDAAAITIQMNREDVGVGGYVKDGGDVYMRGDDDQYGNPVFNKLSATSPWSHKHAGIAAIQAVLKPATTPDTAVKIKQAVEDFFAKDKEENGTTAKTKFGEMLSQLVVDADKVYTGQAKHIANRALVLKELASALKRYELGKDKLDRINGMLNLRELTAKLIEAERFDMKGIEDIRKQLNAEYDSFQKAYGFINDPANASLMADDIKLEFGLEHKYRKAMTAARAKTLKTVAKPAGAEKAALMKGRVFFPVKEITIADNPKDAFNISLSEKGKIDIPYMAGLLGVSDQEIIKNLSDEGLIFQDPDTLLWTQEDEYLSGNVKARYAQVLGRPGYEKNAERLKSVFPADVKTEEIFADLGQTWIDAKSYEEFLSFMGVTGPKVSVNALTGRVTMVNHDSMTTNDMNIMLKNDDYTIGDLFNLLANKQAVVAYDKDSDGKRYVNKERTKALAPIVKRIKATFNDWIFADGIRAGKLTKIYNDTQNTHAGRKYSGKRLKTVGFNPAYTMRNSQTNAAWRMLQSPVTLLDHTVGAGKTMTIITGIMERKRLGLSRKPLVVVPNHLVGQWAKDFLRFYPGANIMSATEKDFTKKNRRRLFARMATGKYDAIIIGHSSLAYIPLEKETEAEFAREEMEYLKRALNQANDEEGEKSRTVRTIANKIVKKEQRIKELLNKDRDDVATFENMGFDYIALDESHEFKNLEYSSSMQAVAGMGSPQGAKKSFDLYSKIQYIIGKEGGVAFATGTPISNSLVEMYTILRYLNRKGLKERNIDAFDSWVKSYASVESRIEYTSTQKLKERQVMASFNNLPELLQLYSEFADVVTMPDLKRIYSEQIKESNAVDNKNEREDFPVPKVVDGGRQLDLEDATPEQSVYMDYLVARASRLELEGRQNDPKTDNALWVMNDARKMALDARLVDPTATDHPNNKVNRAARRIKSIYDKWNDDKGTQIVFCDLSTPAKGADKVAKKFINDTLDKLDLKKHKTTLSILETMNFRDQWDFLKGKLEGEIEYLSVSEENSGTEKEANEYAAKREKLEKYLDDVSDDDTSALTTADVGFSVYDDLRKKLVGAGIPEGEVRFIHEADNPEKKSELFDMVKSGQVRVLVGSSKKMGTGMNVQERAVALHHLDAPWRPSDVEQREGRVVRQNNKLYLRDPDGFMVEIYAYSARNTFDSVMWQVLARKAEMLEQFRSGVRSFTEQSSDSASYAEFMAESTGNPAFKEKFKLEREIEELEATERNITARRQSATGIVERKDSSLAAAENNLASREKDSKDLLTADGFTVDGKKYKEDLAEVTAGLQQEYQIAHKKFEGITFPTFEIEKEALRDKLGKKVAKGKMTEAEAKAELETLKPPKAPPRPTVRQAAKTSETAKFIVQIEKMLEDGGENQEIEIAYGSTQLVITKRPYGTSTKDKDQSRYFFSINGEESWGLRVTMKGVPEKQLMALFNDGVIRGKVALFATDAKHELDSTRKAISNAEMTLDKVKFDGAKELETKRARYATVVEEVNQLEQDMEAKREDEFNKYIDKDRNRFPNGVFSSGKPKVVRRLTSASDAESTAQIQEGAAAPMSKEDREGMTLNMLGLQSLYERLAASETVKAAMSDLKTLGAHVYASGGTSWKSWFNGMKAALGKSFNKFRGTMERVYAIISSKKGGKGEGNAEDKPVQPSDDVIPSISEHDFIKSLSRALRMEVEPGQISQLAGRNTRTLNSIAGVFGHKVIVYKVEDGAIPNIDGYFDQNLPDFIFLDSRTADPAGVLGHELVHAIKHNAEYLFKGLSALPKNKQFYSQYSADYEAIEGPRSYEDIEEEYIGDFAKQGFRNSAFWDGLAAKNPTVFEKVVAIAKSLIDRVKQLFLKHGYSYETDHTFFKDTQRAEKVLLDVMDKYAAKRGKSRNQIFGGEIKRMSRVIASVDPDVEKRWTAAKGLGDNTPTLKERFIELQERISSGTQHFAKLDMSGRAGKRTANILRVFESAGAAAKAKTISHLRSLTHNFNADQMEIFTRAVILGDLMNEAARGHKLPFGYDPITLIADYQVVKAATDNDSLVQEALQKRKDVNREMVMQLVENGLLPVESVLKESARQHYTNTGKYDEGDISTDYYRHQVLAKSAAKAWAGVSTAGDLRNKKRGWMKERHGSELDINTNFLEAEFEWFAQSMKELATKKALNEVVQLNDISAELKAEAKANNVDDWKTLIPEDHIEWQPVKGSVFYRGQTLAEDAITRFIEENPAFADVAGQFREVMIMGAKRHEAIIPVGLAETLNSLRGTEDSGLIEDINKKLVGAWKINTLLNPHRALKYNMNNMSGDLDAALAADPVILKYMWPAFRNGIARKSGRELNQSDKDMIDRGVLDAGISINEIPDINTLPGFKHLSETARNTRLWESLKSGRLSAILPHNLVGKYFDFVKGWSSVREGIVREAAYMRALELIEQGNKVYWASDALEMNSLTDVKDKAAKLSRELLGDYGNLSAHGTWARTRVAPFWSWMEINAPRYYRIFKNAALQGEGGSNAARLAGVGTKKVAGAALGLAEKALMVQLLFALISLYNRLLWPEEEEAMGENGRKQLHIILGKTSEGKVMSLKFQGSFSDVLSWVGLEDYPSMYRKYTEGKMDNDDVIKKMWTTPASKIVNSAHPFLKLGYELMAKESFWPDVTKPMPMRDRKEHVARFFSLDPEYSALAGKPSKGYINESLSGALIYQSDPGEQAYNSIRGKAFDFLKKNKVDDEDGYKPGNKANALYYYRQAIRYKDESAQEKYMQQYLDAGGKRSNIATSIRRAAPLASLPTNLRYKFRSSLSSADKETLDRATTWYREVYKK